ncbi:MAG: DUF2911 domain-containing protein [Flavobacteriales bacterium]|jgi:hypothetical protein|uniref:DUF2911 domain-containing protein n=1 Tax=Candidatus Ulvibacter alkanivorans TaxID=2267620 RepID=UPI000DF16B30|nr:DUF2911 domain-containing protein [Candidatus Ulvibacter alkanivorans]MCH2490680.1 DUF2911 domain-containing protein [Flavobacteriales bacterium]
MKTVYTCIAITLTILLSTDATLAQSFPTMDASPMDLAMARADRNTPPVARVIYSRPSKKGREIFGELVPYDQVWRTGANEATELTLYKPMLFGDTKLDPGTYTLYTIPKKDEWVIIINGDTNVWGSYSYKKEKDIARMTVETRNAAAPTESLSMVFRPENDGTTLMIGWDSTYVEIPFKSI